MARAELLMSLNKWSQALQDYNTVQSKSPKCGMAYFGAAECYASLDNYTKAIELYSEALSYNGNLKGQILFKKENCFTKTKNTIRL